jgi:hypothetical protein
LFAAALSLTFAPFGCGDDDSDADDTVDEDGGSSGSGAGRDGGDDRDGATAGSGGSGDKDASSSSDARVDDEDGGDPGDAGDASATDGGEPGMAGLIGQQLEGEHARDEFGGAVALSADGTVLIVGALGNDDAGDRAGHARVFERDGDGWVQVGADLDGEAADDRFGGAVAISDDGTRVAVGSYLNDGGGNASGHVRVFDRDGDDWVQVGADIDGPAGRGAGWAVDMSASGHRVVVGGPTQGGTAGVVIVHEEQGGTWSVVGTQLSGNNEMGHAVAISDDGNRIAFGLPSANGSSRAGSVQVYDWDGATWTQVGAEIEGEDVGDTFGQALSFSGDGSLLAIGGPRNEGIGLAGGGGAGGHVRVFRFESGAWTQLGADIDGEPGDNMGWSVALSGDGTRMIAGGPSGSVARYYLFVDDAWVQGAVDFGDTGRTGTSVAISADGLVGATGSVYYAGTQGNASGAVRVYMLSDESL